jgi:hypothetical protein
MDPLFISGALFGICIGATATQIIFNRAFQKVRKSYEKYVTDIEQRIRDEYPAVQKIFDAQKKLDEAMKISRDQLELMTAAERPSASASHSRYKNEIVHKLKSMEEQKTTLLKEVLDAGYNPTVTAFMDGKKEEIKLSDYLARSNPETFSPSDKTETKSPQIPKLKLVRSKEIKNDAVPSAPS